MSDEMRDALAEAMCDLDNPGDGWDDFTDELKDWYRRRADALLPLIREAQADAWDQAIEAFVASLGKPLNDDGFRDLPKCPYRGATP